MKLTNANKTHALMYKDRCICFRLHRAISMRAPVRGAHRKLNNSGAHFGIALHSIIETTLVWTALAKQAKSQATLFRFCVPKPTGSPTESRRARRAGSKRPGAYPAGGCGFQRGPPIPRRMGTLSSLAPALHVTPPRRAELPGARERLRRQPLRGAHRPDRRQCEQIRARDSRLAASRKVESESTHPSRRPCRRRFKQFNADPHSNCFVGSLHPKLSDHR